MLCSAFVESLAEFLPPWYFEILLVSSCGLEKFGSSNNLFYTGASERMNKWKQMFFLESMCAYAVCGVWRVSVYAVCDVWCVCIYTVCDVYIECVYMLCVVYRV